MGLSGTVMEQFLHGLIEDTHIEDYFPARRSNNDQSDWQFFHMKSPGPSWDS